MISGRNISRRDYLKLSLAVGAALTIKPHLLWGEDKSLPLITRAIPSSGEQLPVVRLGSSATFSSVASSDDIDALLEVFRVMVDNGGKVFDTAPSYGASEEVAANIVEEQGIAGQ